MNLPKIIAAKVSSLLGAGKHVVRIVGMGITTDRHSDLSGNTEKPTDKLPKWCDATPQVALVFGSDKGEGTFTHRFSLLGYLKMSDVPEADRKNFVPVATGKTTKDGTPIEYACKEDVLRDEEGVAFVDENGNELKGLQRVKSEKATATAIAQIQKLASAMRIPEGTDVLSTIASELQKKASERTKFCVTIKEITYAGNTRFDVAGFSTETGNVELENETVAQAGIDLA